jgi:integrase/recombinase XerD
LTAWKRSGFDLETALGQEPAAVVEAFLKREGTRLSPKSYPMRQRAVIRFCRFLAQHNLGLLELNREVLTDYTSWLWSQVGKRDCRNGRTRETLTRDLASVRQLLGWLVDTGRLLLIEIPEPLRRTRGESRPVRGLSPQEVESWFALCDLEDVWGLRDRALFELTYGSGLRISEALALKIEELDLLEARVMVGKSKNGEGRMVPLTERAAVWLGVYLERVRPELPMLRKHRDLVWCNICGQPLTASSVHCRISGLYAPRLAFGDRIGMHVLRHSYATGLVRGGAEADAVRKLLGHKLLVSTALYTDVSLEDLRSVMQTHPRA